MPKKSKQLLLAEIAYEKSCVDVKQWFKVHNSGQEDLVSLEDVKDLWDRVALKAELRAEAYPTAEKQGNG